MSTWSQGIGENFQTLSKEEFFTVEKRETCRVGIERLDHDFGFPTGYYVIVAAPGTGKSWFGQWLCKQFYRLNGVKSMVITLEMSVSAYKERLIQQFAEMPYQEFDEYGAGVKADEVYQELAVNQAVTVFDFSAVTQGPSEFEQIIETGYKLGMRAFVFDHYHELSGSTSAQLASSVCDLWSGVFKKVTMKYPDIWLFVLAQPNKTATKKTGLLEMADIMFGSKITQQATFVITLTQIRERNQKGELQAHESVGISQKFLWLYIDKARFGRAQGSAVQLILDDSGNFRPVIVPSGNASGLTS